MNKNKKRKNHLVLTLFSFCFLFLFSMTFISAYGYGSYSGYGYNTLQQQNTQSCSSTNKVSGFTLNTDGTFSLTCSPINGFVTNETDPFWTANYSSFLNIQSLATNGTFTIGGATWGQIGNGTVAFTSILNNGTYSNVLAQTLTTNGTFYLNSNPLAFVNFTKLSQFTNDLNIGNWTADKGSYTLLSVLNNGSYINVPFSTLTTNNTFAQLTGANFTGLLNTTSDLFIYKTLNLTIPYYLTTNGTFAQNTILNNGTYSKGTLGDTIGSNNTFAQLASTTNPTNANFTGNLSVFQNFTVDAGTFNIDSNNNKISVGGNLNITTAGNITINTTNRICLNYACSQWMLGNATGVFIQG